MNRALKIALGLVVSLILIVGGVYIWAVQASGARLAKTWPEVTGKKLPVPHPLTTAELKQLREELKAAGKDHAGNPLQPIVGADGAQSTPDPLAGADLKALAMERAKARGKHLYTVRLACKECHGADLGGRLIVDAQPVWTWYGPNISKGGVTKDYTVADWDRIIRHGVKSDDTSATMPAIDYMALSDREVSDLIAYARSMPAVDRTQPPTLLGPVGHILLATGKMPVAAELIDHAQKTVDIPPKEAVSVEYGRHIAQPCVGCHRLEFEGGPIAAGPPDWPPAPNLTQAGNLKTWTEADFLKAMRTGVRPDGRSLNPVAMPWPVLKQMSDLELRAIWAYLSTLKPVPTGT